MEMSLFVRRDLLEGSGVRMVRGLGMIWDRKGPRKTGAGKVERLAWKSRPLVPFGLGRLEEKSLNKIQNRRNARSGMLGSTILFHQPHVFPFLFIAMHFPAPFQHVLG
jgi:hypothetical protein